MELFFEDEGCSVINGQLFPIKKGNILFAKPGDLRQSILPFKCKFLHFDNILYGFIPLNIFGPDLESSAAVPAFFHRFAVGTNLDNATA